MKDRAGLPSESRATGPRPRVGERFNPHHEICSFYPPDIVGRQLDMTDGQKRLYERAVRWAGRSGRFWYGFETMARELGKSSRQIKRDMEVLEHLGLIEHDRRGRRETNIYYFLYHPMFDGEVTSAADHPGGAVTNLSGEVTSASLREVTPASLESYKKNYIKESSSKDFGPTEGTGTTEQSGDDDLLIFEEKTPQDPETILELIISGESQQCTDPLMGTGPLPKAFLESAAHAIHSSKCKNSFGIVDPDLFPPPDLTITARIVGHWRGKGTVALFDWICTTIERQLGAKGKAGGSYVYGLYLADSEAFAKDWVPGKLTSRKLSEQVALQKLQAEQRIAGECRRQLLETPVVLADSISILDSEVPGWQQVISPRFFWLTRKTTSEISPAELHSKAKRWRPCRKCEESGTIGSPLKRTLSFCDCEIGRQEQLDRGDEYISRETDDVNATFKSRLVRACRELKLDFTGDAVAQTDTEVTEKDSVIEIRPGIGAEICCDEADLNLALKHLGDARLAFLKRAPKVSPGNRSPLRMPVTEQDINRAIAERHRQEATARKQPGSEQSVEAQSHISAL